MARKRPRILVLSRITTFEQLSRKESPKALSRMESRSQGWFERILEAHEEHQRTLELLRRQVRRLRISARFVQDMEGKQPARFDAVVTAGGDGTVLHASHHVDRTPMLGVRSSRHSAGFLTGADPEDLPEKLARLVEGSLESSQLQRMSVYIGRRLAHDKVLNEALFTHPNPAVTTRYVLKVDHRSEDQMSSGVWVGPAAGSTAAMRAAGGRILSPTSRNLQWVVREPFRRAGTRYRLVRGLIGPGHELVLANKWQPARLFLDGPHLAIPVRPAQSVHMRLSDKPLTLLGWSRARGR